MRSPRPVSSSLRRNSRFYAVQDSSASPHNSSQREVGQAAAGPVDRSWLDRWSCPGLFPITPSEKCRVKSSTYNRDRNITSLGLELNFGRL